MISQYDKDMCCLYIAEGMSYIWQQKGNQELSRILKQSHNIIDLITEPGTTVCRFKVWHKLLPQCAPRRIGLRREIAHQFDCIGWTVLDSLLTQDAFLEIVGKRQQPSIQVITIISIRFKIHGYYILLSMLFSCFIDIVFFP